MMVVLEIVGSAGGAGRGAYTIDVFPREERVRSLAFMRAALNIGFTLGALHRRPRPGHQQRRR